MGGGCGGIVGPGPPPLLMSEVSLSDELLDPADDGTDQNLGQQSQSGGPEEDDPGLPPDAIGRGRRAPIEDDGQGPGQDGKGQRHRYQGEEDGDHLTGGELDRAGQEHPYRQGNEPSRSTTSAGEGIATISC